MIPSENFKPIKQKSIDKAMMEIEELTRDVLSEHLQCRLVGPMPNIDDIDSEFAKVIMSRWFDGKANELGIHRDHFAFGVYELQKTK